MVNTPPEKSGVSIIIPLYNEEGAIKNTVEDIILAMDKSHHEYEIIVVNDGSTDRSSEIIKEIRFNKLKVVDLPVNRGYGRAIKTGAANSQYEIVAITDADGTYPVNILPELLSHMGKFDMVVGARGGKYYWGSSLKKLSRIICISLVNYITGATIPDPNSGLRIFRKKFFQEFGHILSDRFSFTLSLTLATMINRYPVKFVPIEYYKREGKSKVSHVRDSIIATQLLIQIALYYTPMKVVLPFAAFLFLLAFTISSLSLYTKFDTFTISLATSFLLILCGLITYLVGLSIKRVYSQKKSD